MLSQPKPPLTAAPLPTSGAVASHRTMDDDRLVRFEANSGSLGAAEEALLGRWVASWLPERPLDLVVMAHDTSASEGLRQRRLKQLRDVIQRMGVARENIKYTETWLASQADTAGQRAFESVMVRVVEQVEAENEVRPVAHCFDDGTSPS
jgi:type IV pilus biogenesis protein CpaD/CtpE